GSGEWVNTLMILRELWDYLFSTSSETLTGTWTAQAIPEPLTILGSLTALGFGTLFKRSLKGKK
ncbi:PEP-CTERM sorting domain-containing protein, partial [Crocosphaera watsonii]